MSDNNDVSNAAGGAITTLMVEHLSGTRPWVLFLGVLAFIGVAFMALGAAGLFFTSAFAQKVQQGTTFVFMTMAVAYLVMAVLYFFPAYFLVRYGAAIGSMLGGGGAEAMEQALRYQKYFWRFTGILAALMVVLGVLGAIVAMSIPLWLGHHSLEVS